jgi:hypothetical protein
LEQDIFFGDVLKLLFQQFFKKLMIYSVAFSLEEKSLVSYIAVRQFALVFGWKSVLPNGLEFDFLPYTGSSRLSPDVMVGESPLAKYHRFILCFECLKTRSNKFRTVPLFHCFGHIPLVLLHQHPPSRLQKNLQNRGGAYLRE